ncbi:pilus assembly PilX family protein [Lysobacter sp. A289]
MTRQFSAQSRNHGQRGVALIVVLLLLLVVTLLGLASMRGTLLQERMAGNVNARSHAFQSAEAVLREAEAVATTMPVLPAAGCNDGVCAMPINGAAPAWQAAGFWDDGGEFSEASEPIGQITSQYVVEDYGQAESASCTGSIDMSAAPCTDIKQVYRITVRSETPNGAEVLLQSTYEVPMP